MEEDEKMPTNEEMRALCDAVNAYIDKAVAEAGLEWYVKLVVIEILHDTQERLLKLVDVLGLDAATELGRIISEHEAMEAVKQAEDVLRKGE